MVPFPKWLGRVSGARRAATDRRRFCQPKVENLEERCLLSVFRPAVGEYTDERGRLGLFAFSTGQDSHLYDVYYFPNQGGWLWQDQGRPPGGATLASDPALGYYLDETNRSGIFAFATGSDGALYDVYYFPNQGGWLWQGLGRPPSGASIVSTPAAGNYDDPTGCRGLFVFATGSDGHLYEVHYFPGQGGWLWQDHGVPPSGATLVGAPAVGDYVEPLTGIEPARFWLYAFVTGSDGHLYDLSYASDLGWQWQDQGAPPGGASAINDPALGYYSDETNRPGLFAFVTGSDGALYDVYYYPNQGGWLWQSQGSPPSGAAVVGDPAAGNYLDETNRPGLFAFVNGSDGVLYDVYYFPNQGGWLWQAQGGPPSGAAIAGDPAVGNYIDETHRRGIFTFVRGGDNHLYDVYYFPNQGGWLWQDQGMPATGFGPQSSASAGQHARPESATANQPANLAATNAPLPARFTDQPAWILATDSQGPGSCANATAPVDAWFLMLDDPAEGRHGSWAFPDPLAGARVSGPFS
jgi:hypothetical protein